MNSLYVYILPTCDGERLNIKPQLKPSFEHNKQFYTFDIYFHTFRISPTM